MNRKAQNSLRRPRPRHKLRRLIKVMNHPREQIER